MRPLRCAAGTVIVPARTRGYLDLAAMAVDRLERGGREASRQERHAECERSDEAAHVRQTSLDSRECLDSRASAR